jgi:hypothetical protein
MSLKKLNYRDLSMANYASDRVQLQSSDVLLKFKNQLQAISKLDPI